jgi:transaldolase
LDLEDNYGERVKSISELKIKSFADGADKAQILHAQANPLIEGFATNPTLMRRPHEAFAREIVAMVTDKLISFEVFADKFDEMERQAHAT